MSPYRYPSVVRRHLYLSIALLLTGCIFGGTEPRLDKPDATADTGPDATTMPDMRVDGGGGDLGRPDLGPPDDGGTPDTGADTGSPPTYAFEPLRPRSLAIGLRQEFLMGNGTSVGPDLLAMIAHWRVAWGTEYEPVDATAAVPSADFALLANEASQDPLDMTPEDDDLNGTPWGNPSIPLLVVRASLFNNTYLMDGSTFAPENPSLRVANAADPLAHDLPTNFRVYDSLSTKPVVSRATRAAGFEPIEMSDANGTPWPAVLGVEFGSPLLEGADAGARRVALGLEAAGEYTWEGWTIFDNAVAWLTDTAIRPPVGDCVVIGPPNEAVRFHLAARARRSGCRVSFAPGDIDDSTVVIITPGVTGSALGPLPNHPGPIVAIFSASDVLSTLDLSDSGGPSPTMAAYWTIDASTPAWLRANQSGDVQVQTSPSAVPVAGTGSLAAGATVVATVLDEPGRATYFVVEAGDELVTGADAAGDRVAIGMTTPNLGQATTVGYSFLDAAIQWSLQRADGR